MIDLQSLCDLLVDPYLRIQQARFGALIHTKHWRRENVGQGNDGSTPQWCSTHAYIPWDLYVSVPPGVDCQRYHCPAPLVSADWGSTPTLTDWSVAWPPWQPSLLPQRLQMRAGSEAGHRWTTCSHLSYHRWHILQHGALYLQELRHLTLRYEQCLSYYEVKHLKCVQCHTYYVLRQSSTRQFVYPVSMFQPNNCIVLYLCYWLSWA